MARRLWPVRSSKGLADQLIVLGMRTDPKPDDSVRGLDTYYSIVDANARRVETTDLLEVKRGMPPIALELLVAAICEALN